MLAYFLILTYSVPLLLLNNNGIKLRNNSLKSIFFLILILFLAAFRDFVGTDYNQYYSYFNSGNPILNNFELGFHYFSIFIGYFTNSGIIYIAILNSVILFCIFIFVYNFSENPFISIFIFVFGFFYFDSLNIIRQYLSVSVLLYPTFNLINKNRIFDLSTLAFIFLASYIHFSSFIVLIILFIFRIIKFTKIRVLIFISIFILLFFLTPNIILLLLYFTENIPFINEYSKYISALVWITDLGSLPFDSLFYLFLIIFSINKLKINTNLEKFLIFNLALAFLIKLYAINFKFFDRFSLFPSLTLIILFPLLFKSFNSRFVKYFLCFVFILYSFVRVFFNQAGVYDFKLLF